ncbi:unnamed protein product [Closterium sp. Naga37s-1]|nr:unnamed protein product [Closterium sp. Naga37s-1]
MSRYPGFPVSRFPNFPVSRFPVSRFPGFPAFIHSSGMVHGDVCFDNLLLIPFTTYSPLAPRTNPSFLLLSPLQCGLHPQQRRGARGRVPGQPAPHALSLVHPDPHTNNHNPNPFPLPSLAYIHSSGVVHGDVCPDNLLLTDRRRLKIAGFGVARFEADCQARGRAGAQCADSCGTAQEATGVAGSEAGAGAGAGAGRRAGVDEAAQQKSEVRAVEVLREPQGVVRDGEAEERRGVGLDVEVGGRGEVGDARGGAEEGVPVGDGEGGEAVTAQQGDGWLPHDASGETGSVGYMAPEVLAGLPYDRRADVYSFGICLWELLTCETPFDSFDFSEMASAISEGVRPILPHKCPPDIARVMRCCWEGSSAMRPSMPQVIAMLERVNVFSGKEIPVHNI